MPLYREIDLHVHSTCSDGRLSPARLVELAAGSRLRAVGLTDHDTVAGVGEALQRGRELGVEVVPGIEISCRHGDLDMHVLGYFIRPGDRRFQDRLRRVQEGRRERNSLILARLRKLGIAVTETELAEAAGPGQTGRPHIASLLLKKKVVRSREEAFRRYLARGAAAYAERFRYPAGEAVGMIREAGGIAVLAHPGCMSLGLASLPPVLDELRKLGLSGVEVYYPRHGAGYARRLARIVTDRGLLLTGGSDYHDEGRPGMNGERYFLPRRLLEIMRLHE